ncbi:hypothetical protein [Arthrobacter cryoconiti]|uniref:Uncharacterized protein n=1 Tax=Arthrobacter cryoconiti TaxID=748907 RepID=A0ABV8R1A5_9MICC|nr:hypothetical protein [Arthrobacter cryoconiti]MCC9068049.1 hypothetical protein [Arthrobacter cryoconiti]
MTKTRGYRPVSAHFAAESRSKRPQARKIEMDLVLAAPDEGRFGRVQDTAADRWRLCLQATDDSVEIMTKSSDAEGRTVSH